LLSISVLLACGLDAMLSASIVSARPRREPGAMANNDSACLLALLLLPCNNAAVPLLQTQQP